MTFHVFFLTLCSTHIPQQELVYMIPEHGTGREQGVGWVWQTSQSANIKETRQWRNREKIMSDFKDV